MFYSQYTELNTPIGIHNVHSGVYDAIENLPPGMIFFLNCPWIDKNTHLNVILLLKSF